MGRWPLAADWNPALSNGERSEAARQLRDATGPWPPTTAITREFARWNLFIEALGGVPRDASRPVGSRSGARTAELRHALSAVSEPEARR
jgi:hypothetical protein